MSERASPGGSAARVVPLHQALGVGEAAVHLGHGGGGQEEDLGGDLLGLQLADVDLGRCPSRSVAVSVSYRSRTTIQSSFASACRWKPAFWPPTAGFWPIAMKPLILPSAIATNIGRCEWSPTFWGSQSKP